MVLACSTAVSPRLKASGCTTIGVSSTRTVSEPWLIAAGLRRTALVITTVPVRLLTTTRAAASAGLTSIISIAGHQAGAGIGPFGQGQGNGYPVFHAGGAGEGGG